MAEGFAVVIYVKDAAEYEELLRRLPVEEAMVRIGESVGTGKYRLPRLHEFEFPPMTTAARNALAGTRNIVIFNTDTQTAQMRTLGGWSDLN